MVNYLWHSPCRSEYVWSVRDQNVFHHPGLTSRQTEVPDVLATSVNTLMIGLMKHKKPHPSIRDQFMCLSQIDSTSWNQTRCGPLLSNDPTTAPMGSMMNGPLKPVTLNMLMSLLWCDWEMTFSEPIQPNAAAVYAIHMADVRRRYADFKNK